MKREVLSKLSLLLVGLFIVPLFTLTVQATYTEIDPPINVEISGTIPSEPKTFNVYVPNETLTDWTVATTIKNDKTIGEQISGFIFANKISDYKFTNNFYISSDCTQGIEQTSKPSTNIYAEYKGYYLKGSNQDNDQNYLKFAFNEINNSFYLNETNVIHDSSVTTDAKIYSVTFKTNVNNVIKDYVYTNVSSNTTTKDGIYNISFNENDIKSLTFDRIVYFKLKQNDVWNQADAILKLRYWENETNGIAEPENLGNYLFKYKVPVKFNNFQFVRCNPNDNSIWSYGPDFHFKDNYGNELCCVSKTDDTKWTGWTIGNGASWVAKP